METTGLSARYQEIISLAESSSFDGTDGEWTSAMVLAHLALNDRLLVEGCTSGTYDNAEAVDDEVLRQEIDPIAALKVSNQLLLLHLATPTGEQAEREIDVRIVDGGEVRVDQPMTIGRLMDIHAEVHFPEPPPSALGPGGPGAGLNAPASGLGHRRPERPVAPQRDAMGESGSLAVVVQCVVQRRPVVPERH
jgi:hypothetical protein